MQLGGKIHWENVVEFVLTSQWFSPVVAAAQECPRCCMSHVREGDWNTNLDFLGKVWFAITSRWTVTSLPLSFFQVRNCVNELVPWPKTFGALLTIRWATKHFISFARMTREHRLSSHNLRVENLCLLLHFVFCKNVRKYSTFLWDSVQ